MAIFLWTNQAISTKVSDLTYKMSQQKYTENFSPSLQSTGHLEFCRADLVVLISTSYGKLVEAVQRDLRIIECFERRKPVGSSTFMTAFVRYIWSLSLMKWLTSMDWKHINQNNWAMLSLSSWWLSLPFTVPCFLPEKLQWHHMSLLFFTHIYTETWLGK